MKKYFITFLFIFISFFSLYAGDECTFLEGDWIVTLSFEDKENIEMNAKFFFFEGESRIILGKNEFPCFIDGNYFFIGTNGYYITIENDNAFIIIPAHDTSFITAKFRRKNEL